MPLISVLIPFLDPDEQKFREALRSTFKQEHADFEIVLVDNGSSKDHEPMIRSMLPDHITYTLISEPNIGINHALNTGLLHCRGRYIARMDADDVMLPGRLASQVSFAGENPGIEVISGKVIHHSQLDDSRGMEEYVNDINELMDHESMYCHRFIDSPVAHPSVMVDRIVFEKHGNYSSDPGIPEDYEMWMRLFSKGVKFGKCETEVLQWHDHRKRLSRSHSSYSYEAFDKIRFYHLVRLLEHSAAGRDIWIWGAGKKSRNRSGKLEKMGISIKGFIDVDRSKSSKVGELRMYDDLPERETSFIISMVSNRGIYKKIRDHLSHHGFTEQKDFILCN